MMTLVEIPVRAGFMLIPVLLSCTGAADKGQADDTDQPPNLTDDTGSGSGGGSSWSPSGRGEAWLIDGEADNSLFRLEMEYALAPRDGEHYFGWLRAEGQEDVALGPIDVQEDGSVMLAFELGFNALAAGYDGFSGWAGADEASAQIQGTHLWEGQVDQDLKSAYEELLIGAEDTPDGEGTLRAVETTTETVQLHVQQTMGKKDLVEIHGRAEAVANAIEGSEEDIDGNGQLDVLDGTMAILGESGLIERILKGLDVASAAVEPGHPVKDLANWAYDCTQRIGSFAEEAYTRTRIATACASSSSCDASLMDADENLDWALNGFDIDEDGIVDLQDEGTIECAIFYVSSMAVMDVSTP